MATYLYGSQEMMMHLMHPAAAAASPVATTAAMALPGSTGWNLCTYYGGGYPENQHSLNQNIQQQQHKNLNHAMNYEDMGAIAMPAVMSSKFLRATQQLLTEVVGVGDGGKGREPLARKPVVAVAAAADGHELQAKKAELARLLDEVELRYRQYERQMRAVTASFESVAGVGSARVYTALTLRTISRQFRCLRDAIADRIRAARRALGEEEEEEFLLKRAISGGGSRLQCIDRHLRQQMALQQQHNAWRPQRGLPEHSVSVLRAWLFGHFLHPYPKDSDKLMLAKKAGLTRNQVSNWFINARVRLWKPMVEEMYVTETKKERPTKAALGKADDADDDKGDDDEDNNNTEGEEEDMISWHPNVKKIKYSDPPRIIPTQHGSDQPELFMGYGNHVYNLNLLTPVVYPVGELDGLPADGVALTLGLSGEGHVANDQYCNVSSSEDPAVINHVRSVYGDFGIESRKNFVAQLQPDFVA